MVMLCKIRINSQHLTNFLILPNPFSLLLLPNLPAFDAPDQHILRGFLRIDQFHGHHLIAHDLQHLAAQRIGGRIGKFLLENGVLQ